MPLRLVRPHIVGLVLIGIVWASPLEKLDIYVPFLHLHGIFELSTLVKVTVVIKIILTVIFLAVVLLIHLFRDYGKFMPRSWDMKVFCDEEGLESVVRSFSAEERENLLIQPDWHDYRNKYLDHINQLLEDHDVPKIARFGPNTLGSGDFKYKYRKIPARQRYELYEGRGFVEFEFSSRGKESIPLWVRFAQMPQQADDIKPSFADLFLRFSTVVVPTFSQFVMLGPTYRYRLADIKSPTKIRFFPTVEVHRTLYMIDIRELRPTVSGIPGRINKYMIPIGYAVNQFQRDD